MLPCSAVVNGYPLEDAEDGAGSRLAELLFALVTPTAYKLLYEPAAEVRCEL